MNIYETLYNTLETYVFGGAIASGSYVELVAILVSTIGTLFLIAVPFLVVWTVIRLLTRLI